MTKAQLQKIMKRNHILFFELNNVIDFVEDLLVVKTKELEETEPYATTTIQNLKNAAYEVYDLHDYVDEAMEEAK